MSTATKSGAKSSDKKLGEIGKLITRLREGRGITQSDLGEMLGTTQSAIARIENGEQNLSTEMLGKLSEALNKDIVNISSGALNLKIEGGRKLSGEITTKSSKNAAVGTIPIPTFPLLNTENNVLVAVPAVEEPIAKTVLAAWLA